MYSAIVQYTVVIYYTELHMHLSVANNIICRKQRKVCMAQRSSLKPRIPKGENILFVTLFCAFFQISNTHSLIIHVPLYMCMYLTFLGIRLSILCSEGTSNPEGKDH